MCRFGARLPSGRVSRHHIVDVIEFIGRTKTTEET